MTAARPETLPALTSLRFFAAMAIVLLHADSYFSWGAPFRVLPLSTGVSFFFVLSGFILSYAYGERSVSYGWFIWSRFARLWPVHFVTAMLVLLFIRSDSRQLAGEGLFDPLLVLGANLGLVHSIVPFEAYVFSWNSPSWSISTEMFFYLAFPFLLVAISRRWWAPLVPCALAVATYAAVVWLFNIPPNAGPKELGWTFMLASSPLFRLFEFVVGMIAFRAWRWLGELRSLPGVTNTLLEVGAISFLVLWVTGINGTVSPVVEQIDPILGHSWRLMGPAIPFAVIICVTANGRGLLGRILSNSALGWLGQISFSLYLFHTIAMKWISAKVVHEGAHLPVDPVSVVLICIAGAALLHHLVELPARRALLAIGRKRTLARS